MLLPCIICPFYRKVNDGNFRQGTDSKTYIEICKTIFQAVVDFFKSLWDGVTGFFSGIWDGIVLTVSGAVDRIMAFLQPILDKVEAVKNAVGGVIDGAADIGGNIVVGAKNVFDGAKGLVGFAGGTNSTPDTFIAGERGAELITGAKGRKVFTNGETNRIFADLGSAVKSFAEDFMYLSKAATASYGTAQSVINSNTSNRTVNQYNSFSNTFHGDKAGQRQSSYAMSRAAEYSTAELARGLAYAR